MFEPEPTIPCGAGAGVPSGTDLAPDTAFGRYRLIAALGVGGMGAVWRAFDPQLGRTVALKLIRPDQARSPEAVARFLREARLAARLRHPGIVAVHDAGTDAGCPYLAMDHVEGRALHSFLAETAEAKRAGAADGFRRLREEVALLAEIAEAVAYAHAQGVLHRDIKPGNVLLESPGEGMPPRARVMDFGLAKEIDSTDARVTASGQVLGTPAYMSPEQAGGETAAIGPHSDLWALGVILYEILTGRLPFTGTGSLEILMAVMRTDPPRPRRLAKDAPADLEAVCLRCLEREPARRYPTTGAFAEELRRWLDGRPVQAERVSAAFRARRWRRPGRAGSGCAPTPT